MSARPQLEALLGCSLETEVPIGIVQPPKPHRFDLANTDQQVAIECKAFTWRESGNVPSAKVTTVRESLLYLQHLPETWTKVIAMAPPPTVRTRRLSPSISHGSTRICSGMCRSWRSAPLARTSSPAGRLACNSPRGWKAPEYLTQWLAATRSRIGDDLSGSGWRDYEIHVRRHIAPGIGDIPLQALDRAQIKAFYGWVQDGNSSSAGRRPSPKTVHNIHLTLHQALDDAVDDALISRNPAAGARSAPKKRQEMLTWDEDQLRRFLKSASTDRLYPLWQLTAMSGMRRGEVLGLKWPDMDFKSATVTINRQWKRGEKGLVLAPPKTDRGRRTIDIDAETISALREWRRVQLEERIAYEGSWQDSGFVFTRNDGRPQDEMSCRSGSTGSSSGSTSRL